MMNLTIDIGNSRTKLDVFGKEKLLAEYTFPKPSVSQVKKIFAKHPVEASIISSVVKKDNALRTFLEKKMLVVELNHNTPLPLKNRYQSKETLGNDRLANAAGALKIFPSRNCLVIDAGTCVKYDFINSRKEYLGGAISPGLMMRYEALHKFTARLPLVRPSQKIKVLGTNTHEAIISGVQQGILNEMTGYIQWYAKRFRELKVIMTGGDAGCFAHLLNFPIFAAPNLTAIGLNEILQHNKT